MWDGVGDRNLTFRVLRASLGLTTGTVPADRGELVARAGVAVDAFLPIELSLSTDPRSGLVAPSAYVQAVGFGRRPYHPYEAWRKW